VDNPLFFKDNTRMLFGDAKASVDGVLQQIAP
jgi:NAD(P) transhydrogenase subunit beta